MNMMRKLEADGSEAPDLDMPPEADKGAQSDADLPPVGGWGEAWRMVLAAPVSLSRYRRYFLAIAPVLALIWLATIAYLVMLPRSYSSEFTLILPGSGSGSSLNVESIGQAQTSSSSAFSSPSLSPTENYKQLLSADVTVRSAARRAGDTFRKFPSPKIKLLDQTNLINVTVKGPSPAKTQARGEALRQAFLQQLDLLRKDEAYQREATDAKYLEELEQKVRLAQRKLIAFQAVHGLATLEQFNNRIASVDALKAQERGLRLKLNQLSGTSQQLSRNLSSSPRRANQVMRLSGDPVFQQLAQQYAKSNAEVSEKQATLGPNHAAMAQARSETSELRSALLRRGRALTGLSDRTILNQLDLQLAGGRSNLLESMSISHAEAAGARAALAAVQRDLQRAQGQSPQLIADASELADLQRDHRVAEAVFSSALARLDTNKLDPYASYPLVQTLAAPSLPKEPTSPSVIIALAAALAASLLTLLAFALLWLRQPILARILPSD